MIETVILCGGAGTRLWPLSRNAFPKQFVPLVKGRSLFALALARAQALGEGGRITCVGAEEHRFLLAGALDEEACEGRILLEPCARNTAAAIALAALAGTEPDQLMLFCPADHYIPDVEAYAATIRGGVAAARSGDIVIFGILPTFPSTAYGYILQGPRRPDGSAPAKGFVEKPAADRAQALLLEGDALWNAGIFLCTRKTMLDALARHAPDILEACRAAMAGAQADGRFLRPAEAAFSACRAESIDYAVMEHHEKLTVLPFDGAWSDVGSWNALADLEPADAQGNRVVGHGIPIRSSGTYVHAPHRPVVAVGVRNLLIVDTPDALLVADRDQVEHVKAVVPELKARNISEAVSHRKVMRPWGWYDCMDRGERFQVKRIMVKPGASLSLQMHHHRAEHWIVVKGTAQVTRGADTFLLTENQSTYIPIGEKHRLFNPGKTELEMIEVQSGGYLGEDDIVRLEDVYGRTVPG
ncbi:mannose-1-phosphate guanylyltransferase/mannose-6-phosphate isomerase [Ramlibacter sp.]|uniref:mannose-1-phosphate guanylyltransferase/mannose-6-phosphate isomerase n=1 Tax=Ramlibacter sp. TaxID=1917967 RepID=UPI003D0C05C0